MPIVTQFAEETQVIKGLSIPQIRVLQVLASVRPGGGITRTRISERAGTTAVLVGKAVGKTDPIKRAEFENTKDGGFRKSLLSLGYVVETLITVEGLEELIISITPSGREMFSTVEEIARTLPPPRNSYDKSKQESEEEEEIVIEEE